MPLVPPSRLKTRYKTYAKQWRRCFWIILEERKANGLAMPQAKLAIFLDSLSAGDIETLSKALRAEKVTPVTQQEVQELLTDLKEKYG